jgi:hypothetical protein
MTEDLMTIDEVYTSATHASNLRVVADRRGSADILIAAGWSPIRLGSALLRLHSEFDGAGKPRRMPKEAIERLALSLDVEPGLTEQAKALAQITKARKAADDWYGHEVRLLLGRLKTLPEVRHQLTMQADRWGVFNPADVASAVLMWWLFRVCPACSGIKFELIKETNVKSTKLCKCCRGSGEAKLPHLEEGRRLANHIDACIGEARSSIKKRLRNMR